MAGEPWGRQSGEDPRRDATALTIEELEPVSPDDVPTREPVVHIVEQYCWFGEPHHALAPQLVDLLRRVWGCRRVVVDATGLGAGVTSLLTKALGSTVEPFVFTAASKSRLGFELLAAVNTRRLKMYAPDGSSEAVAFWHEVELAQGATAPTGPWIFTWSPAGATTTF